MRQIRVTPPPSAQVKFRFYYGNGNVEDTIYQENDQTRAVKLHLEVFNSSQNEVTLVTPNDFEAGENNYHFGVKFPKGLLMDLSLSDVEDRDTWDVGYDSDTHDNFEVIYFLRKTELILTAGGMEKATVALLNFCARDTYQSPTANIYMLLGTLMTDHNGESLGDSDNNEISKAVDIINRQGKTNIPLHVGFVGSPTILNDGETENSLTLRITNINSPNSIKPSVSLNSDSQFVVSFETGEANAKPFALAEVEKVSKINYEATDKETWKVESDDNSTECLVSLEDDSYDLAAGDYIELNLSNIVTGHPTGNANMYLRYENIPDYRDGEFVVPIEKSPLLLREGGVGIGTKPDPSRLLEVSGEAAVSGVLTLRDDTNVEGVVNASWFQGNGAVVKGMIVMWYGSAYKVPAGWALCDGSKEGVPDLRARFIVSAGWEYPPFTKGGGELTLGVENMPSHSHKATVARGGRHDHDIQYKYKCLWNDDSMGGYYTLRGRDHSGHDGNIKVQKWGEHAHEVTVQNSGQGKPCKIEPKYYALYYIIKL